MKLQYKIYVAVGIAAVIIATVAGGALWTDHKLKVAELTVEDAKRKAGISEQNAAASEQRSAEYKQKIEYLDESLAGIQAIARRQDEELEKLNVNTAAARGDVERAKHIRAIGATADELCGKLAELGHSCE